VVLVPALIYLGVLEATGGGSFAHEGVGHAALLVTLGPVTAIPLLLFSAAVTRVALTVLGTLQYIAPVLQFLVGLLIVGEAMPVARWVGFGLVWVALVILSADGLHSARRSRVAMREPALAAARPPA
jgi:chloramphenicol-sensitive protein RarD